jgi:hypothetical protein
MPPKRSKRAQGKQARSKLTSEFDNGFIGPTPYFLPLDIPTKGGQPSLPAHIDLTDSFMLFSLFIGDDQLHQWCIWTNEHAKQTIEASQASVSSRNHDWRPIDLSEMRTIITIIIAQGLYPLPNHKEY